VGSIEMHLDEMFLCQNVLNLESEKVEHAVQHYPKEFMKPTLKSISQFDITKTKGYVGPINPKQVSNPTCRLNDHAIQILPHSCKIFVSFSPTICQCLSNILISPINATMIELFLKCRYSASSL